MTAWDGLAYEEAIFSLGIGMNIQYGEFLTKSRKATCLW